MRMMPNGHLRSRIVAAFDQDLWHALQIMPGTAFTVNPTIQPTLITGLKKDKQGTRGLPAAITAEKDDDGNIVLLVKIVNADAHWLRLDGTNTPSADYSWTTKFTTTGNITGGATILANKNYNGVTGLKALNENAGIFASANIAAIVDDDPSLPKSALLSAYGNTFVIPGFRNKAVLTAGAGMTGFLTAIRADVSQTFCFVDHLLNTLLEIDSVGNVENPKIKLTATGGYAIKLTNRTGSNSVKGEVVIASVANADSVTLAAGGELMPIGFFLDSGIANTAEAWIVVSGIAEVRMDAGGCILGDRIVTSATAGRGDADNNPSVAVHFQEIGHAIGAAGANATAKCVVHFN